MAFRWQATNRHGDIVTTDHAEAAGLPREFDSQESAEEWLGENFEELRAAGFTAVSLHESGDRVIYGPMGLDPA